jgi:NADPH-dependent ferric siderophore reductase
VQAVSPRGPRLTRVVLGGPELVGMPVPDAAASVRLLLPSPGTTELVMPEWNGNEFLLPDGTRPVLRTFTPWRTGAEDDTIAIDVVDHGGGAASTWAARAEPGMPCALSGPGRGSAPAAGADAYLLLGDESAMPAIEQVLAVLPATAGIRVVVELSGDDARLPALDAHAEWTTRAPGAPSGATLLTAVQRAEIGEGTRVWAAGEAAGMQRIRRHLFEERGIERRHAIVRGYWKTGRAEGDPGDNDHASD